MGVVRGAVGGVGRTVGRAATAATAAAGAVGGAAVSGVVGGVTGATAGIKRGLGAGSKSTPAAALAIGALGAAGLVEWPILVAVGGGVLLLRRMNQKPQVTTAPVQAKLTTVPTPAAAGPEKPAAARKPAARKTAGRRANTTGLRSTN